MTTECAICAGPERDEELDRVEVWRNGHWRLSLSTNIINGEVEERKLPSEASEIISPDHPDLPESEIAALNQRVRELMAR